MPLHCNSRRLQVIFIIAATIVIVVVLSILFLFSWPSFARGRIMDNVLFKNGTLELERFTTTADLKNLRISFNVFNVTNADEVIKSSAKIQVEEIGPFVYYEYKSKEILDNNQASGLITYKLRRRFTFKPELSVGDPKKMNLTWINVPVLAGINVIEKMNILKKDFVRPVFNGLVRMTDETTFITDTVANFIFDGSYRPLFEELYKIKMVRKQVVPWPLPDNKFAILYNRNNTWLANRDYNFTSSAGFGLNQTHIDLNQYKLMNGSSTLPFWNPDGQCNRLGGTDGEFFSPFVNKSEHLEVYSMDICRKLSLQYRRTIIIQGIRVYEYSLAERDLQSAAKNPENSCYCLEKDRSQCNVDGLIDLSKCIADEVVASGSHFLYGSPELSQRIGGLRPANVTNDEPIIHIEPNTGLSIQVKVPIQINVKLRNSSKYPIISFFKDPTPLIIPLITVTEAAELDQDQATLLRSKLLILDSWFILMILGGAIILVLVIITIIAVLCMRNRYRARQDTPRRPASERDPLLATAARRSPNRSPSPPKTPPKAASHHRTM